MSEQTAPPREDPLDADPEPSPLGTEAPIRARAAEAQGQTPAQTAP